MKSLAILALLAVAGLCEVGGDALMRSFLHSTGAARFGWFAASVAVLAAYGLLVNLGPWDFGRVIGVYVVLVFLIAQAVNFFAYGIRPSLAVLVGGGMIMVGGLVLAATGRG